MKRLSTVLSLVVLVALVSGCSTLDKLYTKQTTDVPARVVGTNTVYQTNDIVIPAVTATNAAGAVQVVRAEEVKRIITPIMVPVIEPAHAETVLVDKPGVTGAIGLTTGVAGAAGVPGMGLLGIVLGWAYTGYRNIRNRKALTALVTGIDAARIALNETPEGQKLDKIVKDKLIEHQELNGVLIEVAKLVNKVTDNTVK